MNLEKLSGFINKLGIRVNSVLVVATIFTLTLLLTSLWIWHKRSLRPYEITDVTKSCGTFFMPTCINDKGQIVGVDDEKQAFFWDRDKGLINLGDFGGGQSTAVAINNRSQVIGTSKNSGGKWHAFFWEQDSGLIDIGIQTSHCVAINDNGQAIGNFTNANGETEGFYWDRTNGVVRIGTLGGKSSEAAAINSKGQVTGKADTPDDRPHAFIWDMENGIMNINTLGAKFSYASSINDKGQVVGGLYIKKGGRPAFIWDKENGMVDLSILGSYFGYVRIINNEGLIAGVFHDSKDQMAALMARTEANNISKLAKIDIDYGCGFRANQKNEVILMIKREEGLVPFIRPKPPKITGGVVFYKDDTWSSFKRSLLSTRTSWDYFLWSEEAGLIDLNKLVRSRSSWKKVSKVTGINNKGQIIGVAETRNKQSKAFILTPKK